MSGSYLGSPPLAFAHRGGAALWPENTLFAFERAVEMGFRYIETDLHMTRDGRLVCFHDATLQRTTDGAGRLRDLSLRELKTLDAGYRFSRDGGRTFPFRGRGVTVPTLEEALALHPSLKLNLEIKQAEPPLEEALWAEIERLGARDRVLVAAAEDSRVHRFTALTGGARIATSPGLRGCFRFWLGVRSGLSRFDRPRCAALQVPVRHLGLTVVNRAFVEAAHRHGLQVHVWTVDEPQQMRRLLDLGVDGLMTDRPDRLRDVFAERGLWPPPDG